MKVKLLIPEHAPGLLDPHTKRSPFLDPETNQVVEVADVPENSFWLRRIASGELVRVAGSPPTGDEPIRPLTTRGGK